MKEPRFPDSVPVPNDLLLKIVGGNFSATQMKVILCFLQLTFGNNREFANTDLAELQQMAAMSGRLVDETIRELVSMNVLLQQPPITGYELQVNEMPSWRQDS